MIVDILAQDIAKDSLKYHRGTRNFFNVAGRYEETRAEPERRLAEYEFDDIVQALLRLSTANHDDPGLTERDVAGQVDLNQI